MARDKKKTNYWVVADWKDTDGLIQGFKEILENFNLHMYDMPSLDGSDTYGFIISSKKLTQKEIKEAEPFNTEEELNAL